MSEAREETIEPRDDEDMMVLFLRVLQSIDRRLEQIVRNLDKISNHLRR